VARASYVAQARRCADGAAGALAADPERLARFSREAQVLASLSHPHIAQIYGLENVDGMKALVMELVEGPTLADRVDVGPSH
jgi:serine/threonine-protein kinase